MHKEYQIKMSRTYTTHVTLKFPDDGRDHTDIINDKIKARDQDVWCLIAEKELEQADVDHYDWEIYELTYTE
tara:strand:+ start:73 stop:288 length:216 start_codon:yes stop_codon:yes gene_type:complete